jgi:hypothetical protein
MIERLRHWIITTSHDHGDLLDPRQIALTSVDVTAPMVASTAINLPEVLRMSRVQLALNVADIDQAVEFYSKLFGTEPAKR